MLSDAQENLLMLEQVGNDIHDATASDPILKAIVSRLCTSLTSQNNIIQYLLKNHKGESNSSDNQVKKGPPVLPKPVRVSQPQTSDGNDNSNSSENQQTKVNSCKPLKQAPLGNQNGQWHEVKQKRNNFEKSSADTNGNNYGTLINGENNSREASGRQEGRSADPFVDAVREAERAVVIYNLNLGQSPLLNPSTISSKVTSALIKAAADNLEGDQDNPLDIASEMVNDLLSQVKGMNLFGKGTKPCKDPKNSAINGTFYTVPVKLSLNNKQVAKVVNDMLRQKYKVSTSIPYHRTLKKAITMAHDRVSKQNPGKQVLISLDAANKRLKPFIRDSPTGRRRSGPSNWIATDGVIALPFDAFDPKIKEIFADFSLPTSPTLTPGNTSRAKGQSYSGVTTHFRLKVPASHLPSTSQESEETGEAVGTDSSATKVNDNLEKQNEEEASNSLQIGEGMETEEILQSNNDHPSGLGPES
jgi:hypothetical protein